jgi:hypothetical protein
MTCAFIHPTNNRVTLPLPDGNWIVVKQRLTHGEQQAMFERGSRLVGHELSADPLKIPMAIVTAYLIDWSYLDFDQRPYVITGKSPAELEDTLNHIDHAVFVEIKEAVEAHVATVAAARAALKKTPTGDAASEVTSPSLVGAAGATNG